MSKFKFKDKALRRLRPKAMIALDKMANNAVHEFKVESFRSKSFDGRAWAPRKDPSNRRQLLVRTGTMRSSITVLRKSMNSRLVGSMVPYASYHNSGTRRLPKRQFIGNSRALRLKNQMVLRHYLRTVL